MNSHAPIFPNPVVDPQAAETNPTNINFVPDDKTELLSALRMLITNVDDENVPQVYVAIKDVIEKKEEEMKGTKAEAIIRSAVRKILKESFLKEQEEEFDPARVDQDGNLRQPQYGMSAADRRAAAAKIAHSTPIFMIVRREAAEEVGVIGIPVLDDLVKVNIFDLKPSQKIALIEKNRETGTISKPLPAWVPRPEKPVQNRPAEKLVSSFYKAKFEVPENYIDAYRNAYRDTYRDLAQAVGEELDGRKIEPYEIIAKPAFKKKFKENAGISWDDCIVELGEKAQNAISERLNSQLEKLDDLMIDMSDIPAAKTEEDEKRAYAASDVTMKTLQEVADELELSVAMIKKIQRTALGKFAFGIVANIDEFIE